MLVSLEPEDKLLLQIMCKGSFSKTHLSITFQTLYKLVLDEVEIVSKNEICIFKLITLAYTSQ